MQGFFVRGQVVGVVEKKTAKGKSYKIWQVLYMRNNSSFLVQVKDYTGKEGIERGKVYELPVFPDMWVDKGGQGRISWVRANGG
jgi:hypothetical protein